MPTHTPRNLPAIILAACFLAAPLAADTGKAAPPPSTASTSVSTAPAPKFHVPNHQTLLANCRNAAAYSAKNDGHGVLVLLNGKQVFAQFEDAYTADTPHPLASGTKSFSGTAAAVALKDGLINLDEKVSDTITEWRSDPRKSRITVRQLLDLSSGLDGGDDLLQPGKRRLTGSGRGPDNTAAGMAVKDRGLAALDVPLKADPGTRFIYGPSNFYVFGELMKRKLKAANTPDADLAAYLDRKVLDHIDVTAQFARDRAGNPNLPGGCMVSANDWAKFGELIRHKGSHNGEQLIDPDILAKLFEPSEANPSYGLTWWLLRPGENPELSLVEGMLPAAGDDKTNERRQAIRERLRQRRQQRDAAKGTPATELGIDSLGVMAAGLGKQRLYILPDFGMTIVRFGELTGSKRYQDQEFLAMILDGAEPIKITPGAGAER